MEGNLFYSKFQHDKTRLNSQKITENNLNKLTPKQITDRFGLKKKEVQRSVSFNGNEYTIVNSDVKKVLFDHTKFEDSGKEGFNFDMPRITSQWQEYYNPYDKEKKINKKNYVIGNGRGIVSKTVISQEKSSLLKANDLLK
jgi:hypothetical protein